jgi:hypothetical protein
MGLQAHAPSVFPELREPVSSFADRQRRWGTATKPGYRLRSNRISGEIGMDAKSFGYGS